MKKEIRVAAVQCVTRPIQEKSRNVNQIVNMILKIGSENDLVIFPELSVTGYGGDPTTATYRRRLLIASEDIPGPTTSTVEKAAREVGCYAAFGIAERARNARGVYNSAVLVGPDGFVGRTRKTHLTGEDDSPYRPGEKIGVLKTKIATFGLMVCYDMWFPEVGRLLALEGAEVIAILSSTFAGGPAGGIGSKETKLAMWDILPRSVALANLLHVVACNGAGKVFLGNRLGYWERLGRSRIINALGEIVSETCTNKEAIVHGELTANSIREARNQYSLLSDRIPRLYKPLARQ
jgi:predicted amidohydrolase